MVGELDEPRLGPEAIPAQAHVVTGRTLFLGHFMNHYGHFLTETMSRLWALEGDIPYDNYVFFPFIFDDGRVTAQAHHEFFLEKFGLKGRELNILRHPARFEEIHVPEALCTINAAANIKLKETYDRVSKPFRVGAPNRCVFLSRLQPYGRFTDVAGVEDIFRRLNFEIIYPETLSIDVQLAHYANASVLAGFAGSALHNCVFCPPRTQLLELGDMRSSDEPLSMQQILNRLSRVNASFVPYQAGDAGLESIAREAAASLARAMERAPPAPVPSLYWPASLIAHLAGHGDVMARGTLAIGRGPTPRREIEGISIKADDSSPFKIEYRALTDANTLTPWISDGSFVGARGANKSLRGLGVRLTGPQAYRFVYDCVCGFADSDRLYSATGEKICVTPDRAPLISVELRLRLR
jgi:hypothetical protein